jgi:peptidoglycan biosynthesis protein MviN/MurJ (putative lipid II flippase)
MTVSLFARLFDERFLTHRLRSTSMAGIISAALSIVLFEYRYLIDHVASWDLAAVGLTFVAIKMGLMAWYTLRD